MQTLSSSRTFDENIRQVNTVISREEAIERLKDMRDEAQGWNDTLFTVSGKLAHSFEVDVQSLDMAIEALSQPERPKGRWIWKINKIGNGCHCVCSECGRTENKQEPFCNCGADMREDNFKTSIAKEIGCNPEDIKRIIP